MIILLIVFLLLSACVFIGMICIQSYRHYILFALTIAGFISLGLVIAIYPDCQNEVVFWIILGCVILLGMVNLLINGFFLLKIRHIPITPDCSCSVEEVRENRIPMLTGGNSFTVKVEKLLMIFPEYSKICFWDDKDKIRETDNITASMTTAFYSVDRSRHKKTIIGSYISNGQYVKKDNFIGKLKLSFFIWSKNGYKFVPHEDAEAELEKAAATEGSSAFAQIMLIHNGVPREFTNNYSCRQCFRVLAEYNGRLCIVEGYKPETFSQFISRLDQLGLTNALYLDMGSLINVSWIRRRNGKKHYCFLRVFERPGNCMTFEK